MSAEEASQRLAPLAADETAGLAAAARAELRSWTHAAGKSAVLARIDRLGAREIETASALTTRMGAVAHVDRTAQLLEELDGLVTSVHAPAGRRGFRLFPAAAVPIEQRLAAAEPRMSQLLAELAGERDDLARSAISGRALGERLVDEETALERAGHLLDLLQNGAKSASRELAREQPDLARFFEQEVADRITERARDVLTQLSVLRQARLSLALLTDGQETLARAVDRTRHIMVSALLAAVAAARAMKEGTQMTGRAEALDAAAERVTIERALADMREALADR